MINRWLWGCLLIWLCLGSVAYGDSASLDPKQCLDCHTEQASPDVQLIFSTPHGAGHVQNSGQHSAMDSAMDGAQCSRCHGSSLEHRRDPLRNPVEISFSDPAADPEPVNEQCLGCHKGGTRMAWQGSVHHNEEVNCLDCHQIHVAQDPVLDQVNQDKVCFTCHANVRAQIQMPSTHPIEQGKTRCSSCHNAHGSATPASLTGITLNDTCFGCHAEKRGPFLFEHAPAAEDCSLCHQSHGSVNKDLLTARTPFLCQQCHSAAFHPSLLNDGNGLPNSGLNASANPNLLGKNCLNCHSQVHGSNHPSGGRLTR